MLKTLKELTGTENPETDIPILRKCLNKLKLKILRDGMSVCERNLSNVAREKGKELGINFLRL